MIEQSIPVIDEEVLAEIKDLLGTEKVSALAGQFRRDLVDRFSDTSDTEQLEREAHQIISAAGAIGLARLSFTARRLEAACALQSNLAKPLAHCLAAREEAVVVLAMRF